MKYCLLLVSILTLLSCSDRELDRGFDPEPLPSADAYPAVSSDGTHLAYRSYYDGYGRDQYQYGIYLSRTDGSDKTWTGVPGATCRWVDGDSSLIINHGLSYGFGMSVFDIQSGALSPLAVSSTLGSFDVSPSGDSVFYSGQKIDSLWSSAIWMYVRSTGLDTALVSGEKPRISPDGRKMCYYRSGIWVFELSSGDDRLVRSGGDYPAWGADTSTIYYYSRFAVIERLVGGTPSTQVASGFGPLFFTAATDTGLWYQAVGADGAIRIWRLDVASGARTQITR